MKEPALRRRRSSSLGGRCMSTPLAPGCWCITLIKNKTIETKNNRNKQQTNNNQKDKQTTKQQLEPFLLLRFVKYMTTNRNKKESLFKVCLFEQQRTSNKHFNDEVHLFCFVCLNDYMTTNRNNKEQATNQATNRPTDNRRHHETNKQ